MYKLRDSKVLDPARREELSARVLDFAVSASIGHASNAEIDTLGMSDAIRLAARRAVDGLTVRPDVCLIDGNWDFLAGYGTHNQRIVHGDALSATIAAASIVAKVNRDRLMTSARTSPRTDSPATRATRRPRTGPRSRTRVPAASTA
jgi:ribonuclease HII